MILLAIVLLVAGLAVATSLLVVGRVLRARRFWRHQEALVAIAELERELFPPSNVLAGSAERRRVSGGTVVA